MAESDLHTELAQLLVKHGVNAASAVTNVAQRPGGVGGIAPVASYIREIITGDQAFDEKVLERVVTTLKKPG